MEDEGPVPEDDEDEEGDDVAVLRPEGDAAGGECVGRGRGGGDARADGEVDAGEADGGVAEELRGGVSVCGES